MKNTMYIALFAVILVSILSPESALAISEIDSDIDSFKDWLMNNVVGTIMILAIAFWGLNALFGWWRGATDWRAGAGLVILAIIIFNAENIVGFFH